MSDGGDYEENKEDDGAGQRRDIVPEVIGPALVGQDAVYFFRHCVDLCDLAAEP